MQARSLDLDAAVHALATSARCNAVCMRLARQRRLDEAQGVIATVSQISLRRKNHGVKGAL